MKIGHILLLNGPPRSGKDTAASIIYHDPNIQQHWFRYFDRFSMPLKRAVHGMLGRTVDHYGNGPLEHTKEEPLAILNGKSYRQAQILLANDHMKVHYGEDVFGRLLVQRIEDVPTVYGRNRTDDVLVVVPDSGFEVEAIPIIQKFGADKVSLVRMHSDGCNFMSDSRSYIDLASFGVQCFDVENNQQMGLQKLHHTLRMTLPHLWKGII